MDVRPMLFSNVYFGTSVVGHSPIYSLATPIVAGNEYDFVS
jgi:hypothetical protein